MSTVVLHVGLMKSGTTFVQDLLFANRSALGERGVLVPGRRWGQQVKAVRDALRPQGGEGAWSRLVEEIAGGPPRSVVSMEFLGPAREAAIRRVVGSLRPSRVEVVCTVRDLNRNLPAMWQETVQNGRSWTWPDYLAGVRAAGPGATDVAEAGDAEAGRTFWRQQDAVRICRSWAAYADRVTVVTVPPLGAPRDELLERFATAAGFDAAGVVPGTSANESIGAASTQALRALNVLLAERGDEAPVGGKLRKGVLAKEVLASRRAEEARIGLPVEDWIREAAAAMRAGLQELSVELVGAWTDLDPVPVDGADPVAVPTEDVTAAVVAALGALVERHVQGNRAG